MANSGEEIRTLGETAMTRRAFSAAALAGVALAAGAVVFPDSAHAKTTASAKKTIDGRQYTLSAEVGHVYSLGVASGTIRCASEL